MLCKYRLFPMLNKAIHTCILVLKCDITFQFLDFFPLVTFMPNVANS